MAGIHGYPWSDGFSRDYLRGHHLVEYFNASFLHHAQLDPATNTDILDVGCADGGLTISTYKKLSPSRPTAPLNILGIDSSQYMVDQARQALDRAAATSGDAIRESVRFMKLDAAALHLGPNLAAIRARFPRGISLILCLNVFFDITQPEVCGIFRFLVSLLRSGGRIVFNPVGPRPMRWTTVYVTNPVSRRVRQLINLAPPAVVRAAEQQTLDDVLPIAGVTHGDTRVAFEPPSCVWLGSVLEAFAGQRSNPGEGTVPINSHATFCPSAQTMFQAEDCIVDHHDRSTEYITSVVRNELARRPDLPTQGSGDQLFHHWMTAQGFAEMEDCLVRMLAPERPNDDAVHRLVIRHMSPFLPARLDRQDEAYLLGGMVLVTLRRSGNTPSVRDADES